MGYVMDEPGRDDWSRVKRMGWGARLPRNPTITGLTRLVAAYIMPNFLDKKLCLHVTLLFRWQQSSRHYVYFLPFPAWPNTGRQFGPYSYTYK